MRIFLTIGIAALLIGCNNAKELQNGATEEVTEEVVTEETVQEDAPDNQISESEENPGVKPQRPAYVRGELGDINTRTDAYQITSAKVEGKILYLTVTFSGGCAEHKFRCIGSEALAKSNPPRRSIKLIHDAKGDSCEEFVTRNIEIDIIPFAASAAGPSEVILDLEGYSEPLNF